MCGRFQLSVVGKQISERFNIEVFNEIYRPSYNCAPSQKLSVITNSNPNIISFLTWGLVPFWAKDPKAGFKNINTRCETIDEKPSFKQAFKKRRCLIPSNGFYEWRKNYEKTPYRIFLKNEELFAMAGIWETWKDAEDKETHSFSIITTAANNVVSKIHNRMPVILEPSNEQSWLLENDEEKLLKLLVPYDGNKMDTYPISNKINSPKNNNSELIIPYEGGQHSLFFNNLS